MFFETNGSISRCQRKASRQSDFEEIIYAILTDILFDFES